MQVHEAVVAGRHLNCQLEIPDPKVSRRHFCLMYDGFFLTAVDGGSANGTYVNNSRITSPIILYPGDIIRVGDTELQVEIADDPIAGPG